MDPLAHPAEPVSRCAVRDAVRSLPWIAGVVYPWLSTRFNVQMMAFMSATAWMVGNSLALLGQEITVVGRFIHSGPFTVEVIEECTGAYEIIIFWAAILAYPSRWRAKWIGLFGGMVAMLAINVFRMMILVFVGTYWPDAFDFMHIYFWQATLILMIVTVWITWIKLIVRRYEFGARLSHA